MTPPPPTWPTARRWSSAAPTASSPGSPRVDPSIRSGAVSVPHGHQGANVNLLTSKDTIDPVTGMARYSGIPVSIHRAPAA